MSNSASHAAQIDALRQSGARVIVLFCASDDAAHFVESAYEAGLGGEGYLWLASDAVANPSTFTAVTDPDRRAALFRGLVALSPSIGRGTARYDAYIARMRALRVTTGNGTHCDMETDDDGQLMWAADHDRDPGTPLECAGSTNDVEGTCELTVHTISLLTLHCHPPSHPPHHQPSHPPLPPFSPSTPPASICHHQP